eukprot:scaffold37294_cov55-Phaeocystis_antarctica.AAC.2
MSRRRHSRKCPSMWAGRRTPRRGAARSGGEGRCLARRRRAAARRAAAATPCSRTSLAHTRGRGRCPVEAGARHVARPHAGARQPKRRRVAARGRAVVGVQAPVRPSGAVPEQQTLARVHERQWRRATEEPRCDGLPGEGLSELRLPRCQHTEGLGLDVGAGRRQVCIPVVHADREGGGGAVLDENLVLANRCDQVRIHEGEEAPFLHHLPKRRGRVGHGEAAARLRAIEAEHAEVAVLRVDFEEPLLAQVGVLPKRWQHAAPQRHRVEGLAAAAPRSTPDHLQHAVAARCRIVRHDLVLVQVRVRPAVESRVGRRRRQQRGEREQHAHSAMP